MIRYFKASATFYEAVRAGMDAGRGYVLDVVTQYGRALTSTSFPPHDQAPCKDGMCYLALHEWQYEGMPDAKAMLAAHLDINIFEVTAEEYQSAQPTLQLPTP